MRGLAQEKDGDEARGQFFFFAGLHFGQQRERKEGGGPIRGHCKIFHPVCGIKSLRGGRGGKRVASL